MFTILDLIIIAVLILSALLAAWRGFTREVLSIGAWVGAAVVMFIAGKTAIPFAAAYIENETVAMIAAYAAVFILALIPLSYISFRIAEGVQNSAIGPVDRLLGLVFGAARGLVIVGIGHLVFVSLVSESRMPEWYREARLLPLMNSTGNLIASVLPSREAIEKIDGSEAIIGGRPKKEAAPTPEPTPTTTRAPRASAPAEPQTEEDDTSDAQGYGERERDALDQLIGSATASPDGNNAE